MDAERREAEDDYRMALVLADEDWQRVEAIDEERSRLLQAPLAVVYTRVRQTPIAQPLPDPAFLVHREDGDLVPGCGEDEEAEIPDELDPFVDALWEVPMGDWRSLRSQQQFLPIQNRLQRIAGLRDTRLRAQPRRLMVPYPRLGGLLRQQESVLTSAIRRYFQPVPSLAESRRRALQSLSIADLLQVRSWRLRQAVHRLHDNLELAAGCILGRLRQIPAAQRYDWAQLAEDDELITRDPLRWPGLPGVAEDDESAAELRVLVQLVDWLWKQLDRQGGDDGRTAVHQLIRH